MISNEWMIYVFDGFILDEEERELFKDHEDVRLTETEYRVLHCLLTQAGKIVSIADLMEEVWPMDQDVKENNVPKHIGSIRKKLDPSELEKYIKTEKKAYRFIFKPVTPSAKYKNVRINEPTSETESEVNEAPAVHTTPRSFEFRHKLVAVVGLAIAGTFFLTGFNFLANPSEAIEKTVFIVVASFCYGAVLAVGLILECAYEFDRYGWNTVKFVPVMFFLNAGAMFSSLSVSEYFLIGGSSLAFWIGLAILVIAATSSCAFAFMFLPNRSLVVARFQTQSALGAFFKNVFMYFLPLYSIFVLLIFCLAVVPTDTGKSIVLPVVFSVGLLALLLVSFISTNYLSDNLVAHKRGTKYRYHGLYSSLLQLRTFFCFGPGVASIAWYFSVCLR